MAKKHRVSVMVKPIDSKNIFICDFVNNGDISIKVVCDKIYNIENIEQLIREHINPIISVVSNFLAQNYQYKTFDNLKDENVEILGIDYKISYPINKPLKISKNSGCVRQVFNVIQEISKAPIKLQYKRVSNFSEMESLDALSLIK